MTRDHRKWAIVVGAALILAPPLWTALAGGDWRRVPSALVTTVPFGLATIAFGLLAYRKRDETGPEAEPPPDDWPRPEDLPHCAKIAWPGVGGRWSRIVVDPRRRTIHFERCYTPDKLLAVPLRYHSCPVNDIVRINVLDDGHDYEFLIPIRRRFGHSYRIRTVDGRCEVPFLDDADTKAVIDALETLGRPVDATFDHEAQGPVLVAIAYLLAGGVGGGMLTTVSMDAANFYGRILAGAALAAMLALMVLFRVKRRLGATPTWPLIGLLAGGIAGWALTRRMGPDASILLRLNSVGGGLVAGTLLGYLIQFPPWRGMKGGPKRKSRPEL